MLKVGLTGGLASGKSLVGRFLHQLGCHTIQADGIGHELLAPGGPAYAPTLREFGCQILDENGAIDRRKLAEMVFSSPERLAALNAIVHPLVIQRELEWLAGVARIDPAAIAVVEAAILIETGSWKRFDRIVLAVCTSEQQILRAMRRDGITRRQAEARLSRQMPLEEKRKFAHYVIDTSGAKEDTFRQVERLYEQLQRDRDAGPGAAGTPPAQ